MEDMSEEELKMLLGLGGQNADLDSQMSRLTAQAQMLRGGGAPKMRSGGDVVKAPHWMELVGGLAQQAGAAKLDSEGRRLAASRNANMDKQNQLMLAMLLRGRSGAAPGANAAGGLQAAPTTNPGQGIDPRLAGWPDPGATSGWQ